MNKNQEEDMISAGIKKENTSKRVISDRS